MVNNILLLGLSCMVLGCGSAQSGPDIRSDLYQCEGCEGVFDADHASLSAYDKMVSEEELGDAMHVSGTVYKVDGLTPAENVIIYAYQTNAVGLYAGGQGLSGQGPRHGRIRGWVKTGQNGKYSFDTIRPAPYPNATIPAHIHFTILEPGKQPYWTDDIVFTDDIFVNDTYRHAMTNKGGNGIVTTDKDSQGVWQVRRDIFLERHPD